MLLRNALLSLAGNATARRLVVGTPISRAFARRFVAGETLDDARQATKRLNDAGAMATLDYLGENVTNADEARAVARTYVDVLEAIARHHLRCNISLKLTALGLDVERNLCRDNLRAILDCARANNNFVRIDMEGSQYTAITLALFEQLYSDGYDNVGVVLQAYLYRSERDVQRAIELRARVRLCKGAYMEPPEIAYPRKADVDRSYMRLARALLRHGNYPGLATHDERIIRALIHSAHAEKIGRERFEFQMLYGVRRDLQRELVHDGYNLRVYVPFGESWYPYLMRRLAERPANLLFLLRALRHA